MEDLPSPPRLVVVAVDSQKGVAHSLPPPPTHTFFPAWYNQRQPFFLSCLPKRLFLLVLQPFVTERPAPSLFDILSAFLLPFFLVGNLDLGQGTAGFSQAAS